MGGRVRATDDSLHWPLVQARRVLRSDVLARTNAVSHAALAAAPRAPSERVRDQLDDAAERHRVHLGEVQLQHVEASLTGAMRCRESADAGEMRDLADAA